MQEHVNASRRSRAVTPGAAIAARRRALTLTVDDVVRLTRGVMNQKLLSRLENGHASISTLRVTKLAALLGALRWTVADLEEAAGITLSEGLPGAESYSPALQVPLLGPLSTSLMGSNGAVVNPEQYIVIDPMSEGVRGRPSANLVVVRVTLASLMSESVMQQFPAGALVVVEVGASPEGVVAARLPEHGMCVLLRHDEVNPVLRSPDPAGPVIRLRDTPVELRGVARLVTYQPH